MGMMQRKRSILLNVPHKEQLTDGFVQFDSDMYGLMEVTGNGNIVSCGKNLFDEQYPNIPIDVSTVYYRAIYVGDVTVTMSTTNGRGSGGGANLFLLAGNVSSGGSTSTDGVWSGTPRTVTAVDGYITIAYRVYKGADPRQANTMLNIGTTAEPYEQYTGTTDTQGKRKQYRGINNVWSDSGDVTVEYWVNKPAVATDKPVGIFTKGYEAVLKPEAVNLFTIPHNMGIVPRFCVIEIDDSTRQLTNGYMSSIMLDFNVEGLISPATGYMCLDYYYNRQYQTAFALPVDRVVVSENNIVFDGYPYGTSRSRWDTDADYHVRVWG